MENFKDKVYKNETHILEKRIKELENIETRLLKKDKENMQKLKYYRSLVNCIQDDIMVIDKNYKIVDTNRAFLVTCGYKKDKVIGRYCYKVSHGFETPCDQNGEECPLVKVFETGEAHSAWHQHYHSGGWKTWVDIRLSPIVNKKGKVSLVVKLIRDVSDLVKVGQSLEESEAKYRRIVATTRDMENH